MKSLLKKTVVSDLEDYKWNSVLKKLKKEALTFYRILKTIAVPSHNFQEPRAHEEASV